MAHWSYDAVFYHIYPLGMLGGMYRNDFYSEPQNRMEKLFGWTDHLKQLGVNALYLGPLFESLYHGYDTKDYYQVDRRLGTNQQLKELVSHYHNNGIKVILDGVFNHTGREFPQFKDLISNTWNSRYASWFMGVDFNGRSPLNDPFSYEGWNGCYDLVKLNLQNHEVKEHLFNAVRMWIREFDIDGLRLDAADCIDINFLKELSYIAKQEKSDFWLMGEVIHGDYRKWMNRETLDSVTNYEGYKGLYSSFNDRNFFEIAYSLNRQSGGHGIYKDNILYNFADNHDVNRIASQLKDERHLYPLHCLMFTSPGIPSVYYGSEWAVKGRRSNNSDHELRPCIDLNNIPVNGHAGLESTISRLAEIRKSSKALKNGSYKQLHVSHELFGFQREMENETAVVLISSSEKEEKAELPMPGYEGRVFRDKLNPEDTFTVFQGRLKVDKIWPCWARILISE